MYIKNFLKWSLLLVVFLIYKHADASEMMSAANSMDTQAAYVSLMEQLKRSNDHQRRGQAILLVQENMQLSRRQSTLFLDQLLAGYEEMLHTNDVIAEYLFCQDLSDDRVRKTTNLLNSLRDIKARNLKTQYQFTLVSIGQTSTTKLVQWLARIDKQASANAIAVSKIENTQIRFSHCNQLAYYSN